MSTTDEEPSVDPGHLLRALRVFVSELNGEAAPGLARPPDTDEAHGGEDALGWQEAGCLLWDVAALPDDAAFLLKHGLPRMLPPLLTVAAAQERWRALEIALGTAANLACHADARSQLLRLEGLPELLLARLLWVDDTASLVEACRCAAALLAAGAEREAERWWALVLREETLGRLVWIVENTLSTALLERALNLTSCLVTAAEAARASGDASKARLVPLLASLGLLPLLASVLHGWVVHLHAEEQQFAGGRRHGEGATAGGSAAADAAATSGDVGAGQTGEPGPGSPDSSNPALDTADPETAAELEQDAEAGGAVAAEISQDAVLEALGLLEAVAAQPAGEAALNASGEVKDALLRLLASAELRSMQALAASLLAGLEGVGPQLLSQPAALAAVLRRLAAAAAAQPQKRQKGDSGGAVAALASAEEQAEEAEAGWALCSALARVLGEQQTEAEEQGREAAEAPVGAAGDARREALALLEEHAADVLCQDWCLSPRAAAIQMHQAYVLRRLAPLLAPRLGGEQAESLRTALARCEAADRA